MNDLNRLSLLGRVGADPEITTLRDGGLRAGFSVATSNRWKDTDGKDQERTNWHRVSVFNKMAEIVRDNVAKGSQVFIEGPSETREFEKEGVKQRTTELVLRGAPGEMLRVTDRRKELQPA